MAVLFVFVPPPGEHPANDLLAGVFLVLGFLGLLALLASGFLVVNTVNAIIAQQTRQIGVMKAVGARNRQVAVLYLGMVLAYAVLSLCVALPLGALGAYALTVFTASLVNFDVTTFFAPPEVLALEIAVGLLVPLLAALVPVWHGVRVTVREAVSSTGIADRFGRSRFDRAIQRVRGLPRPTLLSIRNTFRRKSRLVLTLSALTLGAAVFMAVFTVRASLYQTLDDALAYFDYDVQVELAGSARADLLETEAERVPGRHRRRGVAVRLDPADPRRRHREPLLHHVRAAARDARWSGRGSRRDAGSTRPTATPWSRRRTCARTSPTCGSATRLTLRVERARRDVDAGGDRGVADPAPLPLRERRPPGAGRARRGAGERRDAPHGVPGRRPPRTGSARPPRTTSRRWASGWPPRRRSPRSARPRSGSSTSS